MAVFSGTSVKGSQQLGGLSTVVNGTLRLQFPGKPIPPAIRVGYIYVYTFATASPFQSFVIDSQLLHIPGLAVNYGTVYFGGGFGMRVDVNWNNAGIPWLLTVT